MRGCCPSIPEMFAGARAFPGLRSFSESEKPHSLHHNLLADWTRLAKVVRTAYGACKRGARINKAIDAEVHERMTGWLSFAAGQSERDT